MTQHLVGHSKRFVYLIPNVEGSHYRILSREA